MSYRGGANYTGECSIPIAPPRVNAGFGGRGNHASAEYQTLYLGRPPQGAQRIDREARKGLGESPNEAVSGWLRRGILHELA